MTDKGKARIVSVKVLALAAVLLSVMAGADPWLDSCQSAFWDQALSESSRKEYSAWSHYALARFGRFSPKLGVKTMEELLSALEKMPESNELRMRWGEYFAEHPKEFKKAATAYRKIYEAAPHHVDNVLFYAKILRDSNKKAEAERIIRKCFDETGRREGKLLCDWVIAYGLKRHEPAVERLFAEFRQLPSCNDLWAVDIAEACYWLCCWEDVKGKKGKAEASAATVSEEEKSRYRARSLELLGRLDGRKMDVVGQYLACMVYNGYGEWKALNDFLMSLRGTETEQIRWWIDFRLKVTEKLGNYEELYDVLDELNVGPSWPLPVLKRVVEAYMHRETMLQQTINVQAMVARKTGEIPDILLLAELLMKDGRSNQALELVESLPKEKLNLAGRLLRNRLLQANDKMEDAYQDFSIMEFESKMNAGKKRPPSFYYQFSVLCLKMKKVDEAIEHAKKAHEMQPDSPTLCNYYGYILADFDRELDLAEKLIRKALDKEPNNIAYIDSLAWVRFRKHDWRGALREMARLMELGGLAEEDPDGEISDHLKQIFTAAGMPKMAEFFTILKKEAEE